MANEFDCCDNPRIEVFEGEEVCHNCGMVFGPELVCSERKAFTPEEKKKKRQHEIVRNKNGPRSIIRKKDLKRIVGEKKALFLRLKKTNAWDKNHYNVHKIISFIINNYTNKLSLPKPIYETAKLIHLRAQEMGLAVGKSHEALAYLSIQLATRIIPKYFRSLDEIIDGCRNDFGTTDYARIKREVSRLFYNKNTMGLIEDLKNNYPHWDWVKMDNRYLHIQSLITRFSSMLGLKEKIILEGKSLFKKVKNKVLGHDPIAIASGIIYLSARDTEQKITQRKLAETFYLTDVTVRNAYKKIQSLISN